MFNKMVISTEELKGMIDSNSDFVLIDVRSKMELNYGMIPGAVNVHIEELQEAFDLDGDEFRGRFGFEKPSKGKLIMVYCRTGSRSGMAAGYLKSKGYNVKNYEGSVQAWSLIDDNVQMYD